MPTIAPIPKSKVTRASRIEAAFERIRAIVGPEHLVADAEDVDRRAQTIIPFRRLPSAYVYPGSSAEVQAIVEIAKEFKLPIWPCSTGKNWGYGAATPAQEGGLVMVLQRMNRIIEVNEELAYAVIEPGVTYRQLNQYLKTKGIRLWTDCTDGPQDGSVLGNALDRGVGETDYGDHYGNLCGIEAVLPNGELVRTGGGSFEHSKSWNVFKWGTGPILEGLFTQSNYGIVTRAGIWLMPEPEAFNSFIFETMEEAHFPLVIDAVRRLQLDGIVRSKIHMINDFTAFSVVLGQYPKHLADDLGRLSEPTLAKMRRQFNIGAWSYGGGLYGTKDQVRAARKRMKRELRPLGRLTFIDDYKARWIARIGAGLKRAKAGKSAVLGRVADFIANAVVKKPPALIEIVPQTHALLKGIPTDYFVRHAYFKSPVPKPESDINPARDNCGMMWAGPVAPLTGRHVTEVIELNKPLFEKHGFDFYAALIVANPRSIIVLMCIIYDKTKASESARAFDLYNEMCERTAGAGYQQYRTSVAYMDRILKPSGTFHDLANTIKAALDPDDLLAPGRYGVRASVKERRS